MVKIEGKTVNIVYGCPTNVHGTTFFLHRKFQKIEDLINLVEGLGTSGDVKLQDKLVMLDKFNSLDLNLSSNLLC